MTDAIAYRGPGGRGQWVNGPAAISHLMLHTTTESLEERQPLANDDASAVLVMDGWLANPDELRAELLALGARLRDRTDAELVLRAFEAWGDECPRHIDGEYALVVWDARRREAFCAKDHAGMRPLHYHWDGKRLLVASDLAGVLAAADFEQQPNLGMLAEHLANRWYSQDETVWEGVMRLLPAHSMRIGTSGPRLQRHWMPPLEASIRYGRDEDYEYHYRELLTDCVRRASRSHLPLACEVSGGLDSSGVIAVAHLLQREGKLLAPQLTGYTYNFGEGCDPKVDELEYGRAVGEHLGAPIREITPFLPDYEWFARRGRNDRDVAQYPNAAMATAIGHAVVAEGSRVVLNGEGGDEFLYGNSFYYHEHLAELDWRGFAQCVREDLSALGVRETVRRIYRCGIGPLMPLPVRRMRRRLNRRRLSDEYGLDFRWLSPELREHLAWRREAAEQKPVDTIRSPARRGLYQTLNDGFLGYARDYISRNAAHVGYEVRSPMYDRRFIEFAFSIPARQRMRGGRHKHVHAAALRGVLPDKVLLRQTDVEFNLSFERLLDSREEHVLEAVLQCGIDFIDRSGLGDLWRVYAGAPFGYRPLYELWAVVSFINLFGRACDEGSA